ncbi:hypothetical protein MRX96_015039 [Rhipicephalus microplus]
MIRCSAMQHPRMINTAHDRIHPVALAKMASVWRSRDLSRPESFLVPFRFTADLRVSFDMQSVISTPCFIRGSGLLQVVAVGSILAVPTSCSDLVLPGFLEMCECAD